MKYLKKIINNIKSIETIDLFSAAIIVYIIGFLLIRMFSYSDDLGGAEYSFLYLTQLIEKNKYLYENPDAFPFFVSMYPPIFPYVLYFILKCLHLHIQTDIQQSLLVGRLISLCLFIFNLYLLRKIITTFFLSTKQQIVVLLVFTFLLTIHFFTFRPDSMKLTCFMLFLYFTLKNDFFPARKNILIAFIFAVIAVFIKHDIAIYIFIYFAVSFLINKTKNQIQYIISFTVIITLCFWCCSLIFGSYFIKNIFNYNIQYPSDIKLNLMFIALNVVKTLPLIIISILNIKSGDKKIRFIALLAGVYYLISNLSLFRVGADLNYTYETAILLAINFSIYINRNKKSRWMLSFSILIYLMLFNKYLFDTSKTDPTYLAKEKNLYYENINNSKEINKIIGNEVTFFTLGKYSIYNSATNLIYGYDLHMERSMELTYRYPLSTIMYSNKSVQKYDALYTNGFVKYIVTENDAVAHEQMKKYYKNYYFYKQAGNLLLYKFKTL